MASVAGYYRPPWRMWWRLVLGRFAADLPWWGWPLALPTVARTLLRRPTFTLTFARN